MKVCVIFMVSFKHFEIELLKIGKVSNHSTKAKIKVGKKEYCKGKIYLNNAAHVDKQFELYDIGEVTIQEVFSNIHGNGLMLFFPEKLRRKETIGKGK